MPRRLSYDDVKKTFKQRGCILLSKTYKNSHSKLDYICHCGNEHSITLGAFKAGQNCKHCATEGRRINHRKQKDINEVKEEFIDRGYILLEDTYIDTVTKMKYKCPNHPDKDLKISYEKFKVGRGCYYCGREKITSVHRVSFDTVKKEFLDRGYELLATNYKNASQKLPYICPQHKDRKQTISFRNFRQGQGCRYCGAEEAGKKTRGENNVNWQGGVTSLNHFLRRNMNDWKFLSLKDNNYRCFITNENTKHLQVHHIKSFRKIRDQVMSELKMPIRSNIGEYTQNELTLIVDALKEKHKECPGIPLRKDIHQLFHKEYGFYTTLNDIYEFRERYLSGEFCEVKKNTEQLKLIL